MKFNFDQVIDRRGTGSIKYDFAQERGIPAEALPLWVADMDFQVPPAVTEALIEKSRHGIFGYTDSKADYFDTLQCWFDRCFGWRVRPEWLVKTPGVVFAINMAIRALTQAGDAVLIQPPVYYPFARSVRNNDRRLVINELRYADGKYTVDFEDFEAKITAGSVKLFILCSPHNPVGRVWTREELERMGEICLAHGVTVVSDEIHANFVYPGHKHLVFANLRPEFSGITVTCTAPSKTFNLAGLQISNIWIEDQGLREKFCGEMERCGYDQPGLMGLAACRAAYAEGWDWLVELRDYLAGNLEFVREFLRKRLPGVRLVEPEGTYLAWLDFRGLGLSDEALDELMLHKAGLWLDGGTMFGEGGEGFQRVNMACPRSVLEQALLQLEKAMAGEL